jgi:hypothetical protein
MSFFSKIGSFFKKLFTNAPSWSQTASTTLTLAAPLISTVVGLVSGPDNAAEALQVAHEVQADLTAASALISQAHGTNEAGNLAAILQSVNSNLDALLGAGHIRNPETLSKVKTIVGTISGEVSAIISVLPKSATPAA